MNVDMCAHLLTAWFVAEHEIFLLKKEAVAAAVQSKHAGVGCSCPCEQQSSMMQISTVCV